MLASLYRPLFGKPREKKNAEKVSSKEDNETTSLADACQTAGSNDIGVQKDVESDDHAETTRRSSAQAQADDTIATSRPPVSGLSLKIPHSWDCSTRTAYPRDTIGPSSSTSSTSTSICSNSKSLKSGREGHQSKSLEAGRQRPRALSLQLPGSAASSHATLLAITASTPTSAIEVRSESSVSSKRSTTSAETRFETKDNSQRASGQYNSISSSSSARQAVVSPNNDLSQTNSDTTRQRGRCIDDDDHDISSAAQSLGHTRHLCQVTQIETDASLPSPASLLGATQKARSQTDPQARAATLEDSSSVCRVSSSSNGPSATSLKPPAGRTTPIHQQGFIVRPGLTGDLTVDSAAAESALAKFRSQTLLSSGDDLVASQRKSDLLLRPTPPTLAITLASPLGKHFAGSPFLPAIPVGPAFADSSLLEKPASSRHYARLSLPTHFEEEDSIPSSITRQRDSSRPAYLRRHTQSSLYPAKLTNPFGQTITPLSDDPAPQAITSMMLATEMQSATLLDVPRRCQSPVGSSSSEETSPALTPLAGSPHPAPGKLNRLASETDPFSLARPIALSIDTNSILLSTSPIGSDDLDTTPLQSTPAARNDESFYHALLELVRTEEGYTADLTDLVEVHFASLAVAKFVTAEQKAMIIREAATLLDIHRRLVKRLQRVEGDLGWIRDADEPITFGDLNLALADLPGSRTPSTLRRSTSTPVSPTHRRFKSSDATVEDAARRIAAIYVNEAQHLSEAYRPFCSAHPEAAEIVKSIATVNKFDWDAYEARCSIALEARGSLSARLLFADFLIKPIQRLCRYPLLFANILKYAPSLQRRPFSMHGDLVEATETESMSVNRIREALSTYKRVATEVDTAQRQRSLAICTVKLALRMDVQNHDIANLINHLDQVLLIGSGHVTHTGPSTPINVVGANGSNVIKASFYGLLLYKTHFVMIRCKKTQQYEPKHWLPLRLFDMQKVPDGEGILPYSIRLTHGGHTFEVGSLCSAEQNIWIEYITEATNASRKAWSDVTEGVVCPASAPPFDDTTLCSENFASPVTVYVDPNGLVRASSHPGPEGAVSASRATSTAAAPSLLTYVSTNDESLLLSTGAPIRPKLSLKPPAQRVATDLRLADVISPIILSVRAQSKRSHAMPLHGPPPRALSHPIRLARPHSFAATGVEAHHASDPNWLASRLQSRFGSLTVDTTVRPSGSSFSAVPASASSSTTISPSPVESGTRRLAKLQRSKTSVQLSESSSGLLARSNTTARPSHRASSSLSTISKLRRRASSLHRNDPSSAIGFADMRQERTRQQSAPGGTTFTQIGSGVPLIIQGTTDITESASSGANVARNSSTSSSSSCGSGSSASHPSAPLDTPQSSLPASPLLTPIDLESSSRWSKFGDAIALTLNRKRSFASARPILAVQPEPSLRGAQLEQAQRAAEYIYTGTTGFDAPHVIVPGTLHRDVSSSSAPGSDRRLSFERQLWTGAETGRSQSAVSFGDKRQSSGLSLWSAFRSDGTSRGSSPAHSVYELPYEADDVQYATSESPSSSAVPSSAASPIGGTISLPDISERQEGSERPRTADSTSSGNSESHLTVPQISSPSKVLSRVASTNVGVSRKGSISSRFRAFKALGSSMTPLQSTSGRSA